MPSFDIVSEVDKHALTNAVDQASRLITNRYDFKGVDASFERKEYEVTITADVEFQLEQMLDVLKGALHKNQIDIACLEIKDIKTSGKQFKQEIIEHTGRDQELNKKIVKMIEDTKMKVQEQMKGDQVRVTGKKRDDLQEYIAMLRGAEIAMS